MKTLTSRTRHLIALAALAISGSAIASAQYTFVKVNIAGTSATTVNGINNDNTLVGEYSNPSGYYGFTYNPNTDTWIYPINDPQGSAHTNAMSMNIAGQVVGYYYSQQRNVGFVEQPNGSFSNILVPGCSTNVVVTGINDDAVMAGYCQNSSLHTIGWESYPANETFTCFGSASTIVNAVDNWMLMVGTFEAGNGFSQSGFISTSAGDCSLVTPPGAYNTVVTGINDLGEITGWYQTYSGPPQGFVLNGSTYTTVNVPGAKSTRLGQVNNNGWFVGTYVDSTGKSNAFYAIPSAGANVLVESGN